MMKKTAAAVAALMLAACSGDGPSNALFEKTINNYAKKEGVCLPLLLNVQDPWGVESFTPVALGSTTVKIAEKDSKGNRINKTALKQMELLEDEGFYDKAESETLTKTGGGEKIRLSVYKLTRKGTEQVRGGEAEPRFCIGPQKVDKITMYGEGNASKMVGDIMQSIDQVSQGAGFDIRQLLAGALGVNMTVNKLKQDEQPVIEAANLDTDKK